MEYRNNPDYIASFHSKVHNITFYENASDVAYHTSRYIAAGAHARYCQAGITKELLEAILDEMEKAVNNSKLSDVAVLINNLKYRTRYPVDEDAVLRSALIFHYVEGENPNKVEPHWIEHKLKLVKDDPEAYSFFLSTGIENSPIYNALHPETFQSNLQNRRNDLQGFVPIQ